MPDNLMDFQFWLLLGVLAVLTGVVAHFVKKALSTSERIAKIQSDTVTQLAVLTERHDSLRDRVSRVETREDRRDEALLTVIREVEHLKAVRSYAGGGTVNE